MQAAERAKNAVFFVPGDLDLQTCPHEGPNASSVQTWQKSIQRFPEIFHTNQNNHKLTAPKTEPFPAYCVQ